MAFHRKADALFALAPDIAVVQEVARPEVLAARGLTLPEGTAIAWTGENPNKGLAVIATGGRALAVDAAHDPRLRHVLPVHVAGGPRVLGVWAQNASAGVTRKHQLGPFCRALTRYRDFLEGGEVVVSGDLNNSVYWDRPGWRVNHAPAVARLADHGLVSAYHAHHGCAQGAEPHPTLYWRDRTRDGPTYHIDYTFVPEDWAGRLLRAEAGGFDDWIGSGLSDHVPVVVEVGL